MSAGAAHHMEQSLPDSCVAACIGMVRRAMRHSLFGQTDELNLMARYAAHRGLPVFVAARELGGEHIILSPDELLKSAPIWLSMGLFVIVKVSGPVYVKCCGTAPGGVASRHGDLCPPGDRFGPYHVVFVTGYEDRRFRFLDPYYPKANQPFSVDEDQMALLFAGEVVLAR